MCSHSKNHLHLSVVVYRKQWYGLLPRQVQLRPAEPLARLSHQTAENGRGEQHAVPASHAQEAGLGALIHPEDRGPGLDGTDGAVSCHGCGGCHFPTGELKEKRDAKCCFDTTRIAGRKSFHHTDSNFEMPRTLNVSNSVIVYFTNTLI